MTLQKSHGKLYPLVANPDELPEGRAAPAAEPSGPVERRSNGQPATAEAAAALGKRGGIKSAQRRRDAKAWGAAVGLGRMLKLTEDEHLRPFIAEGEQWMAAQCAAVARDVGGGELSPGVVSILRTAAWQRLYSAWLFDCASRQTFAWDADEGRTPKILPRTELLLVAARLGDASRQSLLACHELASREAEARPRDPVEALAAMRSRILGGGK